MYSNYFNYDGGNDDLFWISLLLTVIQPIYDWEWRMIEIEDDENNLNAIRSILGSEVLKTIAVSK